MRQQVRRTVPGLCAHIRKLPSITGRVIRTMLRIFLARFSRLASKQPLVLLPGLMCDRAAWGPQIEALSDVADARSMDWGVEHDSLGRMADAVLKTAPERFALAGHSMGGRVAFEVYRRAPQRISR